MAKDKKFFQGHERLAEERAKLWETQQQAADFFGVSRVTWGQCERGNATPSGDVLAGLAQQGADVLYILTGQRSQPVVPEQELPRQEQEWLALYRNSSEEVRAALKAAGNELTKPARARGKAA
nr:helix-turn-helix transcriptional regulator [Rhodoferax sp.]